MPNKNKGSSSNTICLLKLHSINDIARCVYNFDFTFENLFYDSDINMLFAFGEKIAEENIVYYIELNEKWEFIKYTPPSLEDKEEAELINTRKQLDSNTNCYINIIGLSSKIFKQNKKDHTKDVIMVPIKDYENIIKLAVSRSGNENNLLRLYCFKDKKLGKAVLFGFDLIEALSNEKRYIYYTIVELSLVKNFAVYNYRENKTNFVDSVGEHSYLYLKVINLEEKPSFIKI